ncbi:ribosomal protein L1-like protein [Paraphysoderma sedebokerense]|nr:ribosomal protein L1-like protein [Paraphysoderma sedebokerense]
MLTHRFLSISQLSSLRSSFAPNSAGLSFQCLSYNSLRHMSTRRRKKLKPTVIDNRYLLKDAVQELQKIEATKPGHSIHLHVKTRPVPGTPPIRGTLVLPHKIQKRIRILAFAEGPDAEKAKAAGADIIGGTDLLEKIQNNELEFDLVVSTPQMFPTVTKVAKILGPKGLMPNVKRGTVTNDLGTIIEQLKSSIKYTSGRGGDVHSVVGRINFTAEQVEENAKFLLSEIKSYTNLPNTSRKSAKNRGSFFHKIWMSSTQGKGFPLKLSQFDL